MGLPRKCWLSAIYNVVGNDDDKPGLFAVSPILRKSDIWYGMGEMCQGMKGLGMLDTLGTKRGVNITSKPRFFYNFDVGGLS